jgi:hypothetical protein
VTVDYANRKHKYGKAATGNPAYSVECCVFCYLGPTDQRWILPCEGKARRAERLRLITRALELLTTLPREAATEYMLARERAALEEQRAEWARLEGMGTSR